MKDEISIDEAKVQQRALAARVETADRFQQPVRLIGGADVAYDDTHGLAAGVIAVLDADTHAVVEIAKATVHSTFPYVPGLFSFREIPPLIAAWRKLQHAPDVVICDGHGLVHPRRFGMACHLGVALDVPAIGCAKRPFIGKTHEPGPRRGDHAPIEDDGHILGAALRTQAGIKPVYVSTGHRVSLASAIDIVLAAAPNYRQPETTRIANELVNAHLKDQQIDDLSAANSADGMMEG